jgi:transcriptional regulator with XRE-family HTH domain
VGPRDVYLTDRERVVTSDLVIALCTQPSYGVGIEIQLAAGAGVPVVLLNKRGISLSKMVTGGLGHNHVIQFCDLTGLAEELRITLEKTRPHLEKRRQSVDQIDGETLPSRLRDLRERSNYSLGSLSALADLPEARIEDLHHRDEKVSQPMLSEIRLLADAFGVPTSYLLGETPPITDPIALASMENLRSFALDKDMKYRVYSALREEYLGSRKAIGFAARTRNSVILQEEDWRHRHERFLERGKDLALKLFE